MSLKKVGEISFDTDVSEEGQNNIEGCYRLDESDWKVFYFTHRHDGKFWTDHPIIRNRAIFQSGIEGVNAVLPTSIVLNKQAVKRVLSEVLNVAEWVEVAGPDSLQLK